MIKLVCLDTSFIADLNRNDPGALGKLKSFFTERMTTTVINVGELYKGAYGYHNVEKKLNEVEELIQILIVLEMNVTASKTYGYYYQFLRRRGELIDERDILIASIAISFGETRIVTRNVDHFRRIPEIEVISY